jgi:hypothetical protein
MLKTQLWNLSTTLYKYFEVTRELINQYWLLWINLGLHKNHVYIHTQSIMCNFTTNDRPFHHLFEKIYYQSESDTPTNNFEFTAKKNYFLSLLLKKHNKIEEIKKQKIRTILNKKKGKLRTILTYVTYLRWFTYSAIHGLLQQLYQFRLRSFHTPFKFLRFTFLQNP